MNFTESFADFFIGAQVAALAAGTPDAINPRLRHCDYEGCPGRSARNKKRLIWHKTYLFVHNQCVAGARQAAKARHEWFGFRLGI